MNNYFNTTALFPKTVLTIFRHKIGCVGNTENIRVVDYNGNVRA